MKMILAIINRDDASTVMQHLMQEKIPFTRLSSTGGFLRAGNVTILIGIESEKVQFVIDLIAKYSKSRKQMIPTASEIGMGLYPSVPVEVVVGGATIFVLDVDHFEKV